MSISVADKARLLVGVDGFRRDLESIPIHDSDPAPVPDPDPPPDPVPAGQQRVYYWNGTNDSDTFGHAQGVPMSRLGSRSSNPRYDLGGVIRTYYEAEQGLWRSPEQYRVDALRARDDGCTAWVWDIEVTALFGLTAMRAQQCIAEVVAVLPCGLAPKIGFEHFNSWHGRVTWGMNATAALGWAMDSGISILADWQYSVPGSTFVGVFDSRKSRGFEGTQIAIMDPRRSWGGNRPASVQDVQAIYIAGYNQGWFAPPSHAGQAIAYGDHNEHGVPTPGMAEARRWYI